MEEKQLSMDLRGGKREGSGRKTIGDTRALRLVLPFGQWEIIEKSISEGNYNNYNDFLRAAVADKLRLDHLQTTTTLIVDGSKCTDCHEGYGIYLFSKDKHLCDECIRKV